MDDVHDVQLDVFTVNLNAVLILVVMDDVHDDENILV